MQRKKILLCSDDILTTSGVAQMSKNIITGLASEYDWIQLAASQQKVDHVVYDVSDIVNEAAGISNSNVKLYPVQGYGNKYILENILEFEKPDAIIIFTDPRFWDWLFKMENIIHQKYNIPIIYYSIWDNLPYPVWNKSAYSSCDALIAINKQTHLIHQQVLKLEPKIKVVDLTKESNYEIEKDTILLNYAPHGIDSKLFYPITEETEEYINFHEFKTQFLNHYEVKRVFFWTNRNITRKRPIDVMLGFKKFCDRINNSDRPETSDDFLLLMHTNPFDQNGSNLIEVAKNLCKGCKIGFSAKKISTKEMNYYYNISDLTINIAENEGFGLSSAESMMAGVPVINTVTGGLQDQMDFDFEPTIENPSNNIGITRSHGEWAFPIWPSAQIHNGSQTTPFIMADCVSSFQLADELYSIVTNIPQEELRELGLKGRQFLLSDKSKMSIDYMCTTIKDTVNLIIDKYKTRSRIELNKITNEISL